VTKKARDPLLFRFLNEVGIIDQLARAKLESVLPDGLKISQFLVLNHLARLSGDWSPVRLANAFQVTKGAITNTLRRLESRGFVTIAPDPHDGRGKLVSLTAAGRKMREKCVRSVGPTLQDLEAAFGEKRFAEALPLLEEVRKYLDEHRA
jgi:DNA-binding MarR family transcriptional regulator